MNTIARVYNKSSDTKRLRYGGPDGAKVSPTSTLPMGIQEIVDAVIEAFSQHVVFVWAAGKIEEEKRKQALAAKPAEYRQQPGPDVNYSRPLPPAPSPISPMIVGSGSPARSTPSRAELCERARRIAIRDNCSFEASLSRLEDAHLA